MDPDACLDGILTAAQAIILATDRDQEPRLTDAAELAQAILDLHYWIRHGGAKPRQWMEIDP